MNITNVTSWNVISLSELASSALVRAINESPSWAEKGVAGILSATHQSPPLRTVVALGSTAVATASLLFKYREAASELIKLPFSGAAATIRWLSRVCSFVVNYHANKQREEFNQQIRDGFDKRAREIAILNNKIAQLDNFIKEDPELLDRVLTVLDRQRQAGVLTDEQRKEVFNLTDPLDDVKRPELIDEMMDVKRLLGRRCSRLNRALIFRRYFLQEDRPLWKLFNRKVREKLIENESSKTTEEFDPKRTSLHEVD